MAQGLWKTRKGSCNNVIHEDLLLKVYPPSVWRVYPLSVWRACPRLFWRAVLGKKFLFTYMSSYSSIEISHSQETFSGVPSGLISGGVKIR
jgi:hypothetical protein